MILEELKDYIRSTQENDGFEYTEDSLKKILNGADRWSKDWLQVFRNSLRRIKNGHGMQDGVNNDGKVVALPMGNKKGMMIFFTEQSKGRFLIYDFKIGKTKF
jgi:hypothetical protein